MQRRVAVASAALAGVLAGFLLGRISVGDPSYDAISEAGAAPAPRPAVQGAGSQEEPNAALTTTAFLLGLRAGDLQALASAGALHDGGAGALVAAAVDRLGDREIEAVLASTVRLHPSEIAEIRDLRGFARRLAHIAMEDILQPKRDVAGAAQISFTTDPGAGEGAVRSFARDTGRVFAVFPTPEFDGSSVLVKWTRRDDPRVLLLERHAIVPGAPTSYVWFRPDAAWEPGRYEVDVFTGDEQMRRLASGGYDVE